MLDGSVYVAGGLIPTDAPITLFRAALEGAVMTRWLVDPRPVPRERVGRGVAAQLKDYDKRRKFEAAAHAQLRPLVRRRLRYQTGKGLSECISPSRPPPEEARCAIAVLPLVPARSNTSGLKCLATVAGRTTDPALAPHDASIVLALPVGVENSDSITPRLRGTRG